MAQQTFFFFFKFEFEFECGNRHILSQLQCLIRRTFRKKKVTFSASLWTFQATPVLDSNSLLSSLMIKLKMGQWFNKMFFFNLN